MKISTQYVLIKKSDTYSIQPESIEEYFVSSYKCEFLETLLGYLSESVKEILKESKTLMRTIYNIVFEIERYIANRYKDYKIRIDLWQDVEDDSWKCIDINIKVRYKNLEEKLSLLKELSRIQEKHDIYKNYDGISISITVDKYD